MISESRTTLMLCGSRGYVMGFVEIFLKRRAGNEHVKGKIKLKVTLPVILIELKFQSGFAPIFSFPQGSRGSFPAPRSPFPI